MAFDIYRGAAKSLARPGKRQANVYARMAWISFCALPCSEEMLMSARVSMLMKSRASLTCYWASLLPGRAMDLSAPGIWTEFHFFCIWWEIYFHSHNFVPLFSVRFIGFESTLRLAYNYADFYVCCTVHHCDNWRIKTQLDATYFFIVLLIGSTCFGHYYAHHQELTTIMLITTLVVSFLVCWRLEVRRG